jgi:polar amino acid transport system permease protein
MINETAYCAEIIRGGISSVDRNQRMAAQAFGFSRTAEMIHVVLPQALRAILPTLGNEAVGLLKSTAQASVVGVNELTLRSQTIVSENFLFIPVLMASGMIYVALSTCIAGVQWWLESRFALDMRARRVKRKMECEAVAPSIAKPAVAEKPSMSGPPALTVENLKIGYNGKAVLKDVSLKVNRGEVVALLGRSGSGKSTLLKSIVALTPVESGDIRVGGKRIGKDANGNPLPARHLPRDRAASKVGIVFQHFALFDHLSAEENVMTIPTIVQKRSRREARAAAGAALDTVGLSAFKQHLPHELSGGQQQRVAIARALAANPELILFDEPTSALDPELVREVNQTIRKLAQTGITLVISTHDVAFASTVADRVVFLQGGTLIEQGSPDILQSPRTPEFAAFLRQERDHHLEEATP